MQPIGSIEVPNSDEFNYEVKYDGYRALLFITQANVQLTSRNNKDLSLSFPEIIKVGKSIQAMAAEILPLQLDGEIVILNNHYQSNFTLLQKRGRLKNKTTIRKTAEERPATFMAFDLLQFQGNNIRKWAFIKRKQKLAEILHADFFPHKRIQFVASHPHVDSLQKTVFSYKAEGIVAKRTKSKYTNGKSHHDWYKQKNWRTIRCFLTAYDPKNDYFIAAIYNEGKIQTIGKCKNGLEKDDFHILKQLFLNEGTKTGNVYTLPPAICASIHTLDLHKSELREPQFCALLPSELPKNCTKERLTLDLAMLPEAVEVTNKEKVFWPKTGATKGDLLVYMREVSPYILPFLQERALTVIRSPDGVEEQSFFQKSLPDYAPNFIRSVPVKEKRLIVCDSLDALIWFANHGSIEYHIPFQLIHDPYPTEIVFDLDPPSRKQFGLAIRAALLIKRLLDDLELVAFIKTSGNKGLQIHIPIPKESLSYNETAILTEAIAKTVEQEEPSMFTTERLKKNRKNRIYIDYVQHGKDKTIIAPYSPRMTTEATVATPLFWNEVHDDLSPDMFTITNVVQRIRQLGCPFDGFFTCGEKQQMKHIVQLVKH
ncbi:DNA ligase D [Virgibacillus sp. W0181]|uniref:DNA ligase D n=1 Tax=Virgibacillus sp. W0181 TaxID=3391581 RepID=UPI003F450736